MPHTPRSAVHRGTVQALGFLFDDVELPPRACVERVLSLLAPGDRLLRAGSVVVVRFQAARPLRCEYTPGHALVAERGFLTTFPLASEPPEAPLGSLLWLHAGQLRVIAPHELLPWEPTPWLELGTIETVSVKPLGKLTTEVALPRPPERDVRAALGVPPLSEQALAVRDELERRASVRAAGASTAQRLGSWLKALWARTTPESGGQAPTGRPAASRPSLAADLARRLTHGGLRLLSALGMLWVWLAPHQRYLRKLDRLFAQGDILEALRNALPLAGKNDADGPSRLALSPPGRRAELTPSLTRAGASTVLPVDDAWRAHLQNLYEQAFNKLEREGDIDHAAFVLSELLRDVPRAIQFLEKHGRLRLAAQLAETHELSPGERVRLWFLAGDVARAIAVARVHGAYADAVARLEKKHAEAGKRLRLSWADHAAQSGEYLLAARVAGDLPEAHALVRRWLELATGDEGPTAHAAWVSLLALDPTLAPRAHAALAPVLSDEHEEGLSSRASLAREIAGRVDAPAVDALVTPLLRALARDTATHGSAIDPKLLGLLERAPVLRADWPKPAQASRATVPDFSCRTIRIPASERGTMAIHDAIALPAGRTLVALGQLGAMLLSRKGKMVMHWEREPVEHLIPRTRGSHVLTMSNAFVLARLGRLDLATQKHERWFDLRLSAFADHFADGSWYVGAWEQQRLVGLDTLEETPHALTQAPTDHMIVRVQLAEKELVLVTYDGGTFEQLTYELPGLVLRSRFALPEGARFSALGGAKTLLLRGEAGAAFEELHLGRSQRTWSLPTTFRIASEDPWLASRGDFAWVIQRAAQAMHVDVFHLTGQHHIASVTLEAAQQARARLFDGTLLLGDDLGRLLRVQLARRTHSLLRV